MSRVAILWLAILIISASTGSCEEIAYAFNESGCSELDQHSVSEYDGSEVIAFTTASAPGGGGQVSESKRTLDSIKKDFEARVCVGDPKVREAALGVAGLHSAEYRIDQICEIYDKLRWNWSYVSDWRGVEYFQYANETLRYGDNIGIAGVGDCDDFAILMSSLIESIGGSTRIMLAYGPEGGHAYTEVYLGQLDDDEERVQRIIKWLREEYQIKDVHVHGDPETNYTWLNLDWSAENPGGPFFNASDNTPVLVRDIDKTNVAPINELPVAIFTYNPLEPSVGANITFDASQSYDPYGQIVNYEWDFGGKTAEGVSVNYSYSEGGTFLVNLTVVDDKYDESTNSTLITINWPPLPNFTYSIVPSQFGSGYLVTFNASESKDEDGRITSYEWGFEKGAMDRGISINRYYSECCTFIVNLTVVDDKSAKRTESKRIKINEDPIPKISFSPTKPNPGEKITFDASQSKDNDGNITKYKWYFGDETNASEIRAEHAYSEGGNFTVILEVEDDDNATASIESPIYVNKPPVASFTYDPTEPVVGDPITFVSDSSDEDGEITTYEWDFGDGNSASKVAEVDHNYLRARTLNVTLRVTDDNGASNTFETPVAVRDKQPQVVQEEIGTVKATEATAVVNKTPMMLQQDGLSPREPSTVGVLFTPYFVPLYDYAELEFTVPSEIVVESESRFEGNYAEGKYLNASLFTDEGRVLIDLLFPCEPPGTQLDVARLKSVVEAFDPGLNQIVYSPAPLNIGDRLAIWGRIGNDILVAYQPSDQVISIIFFDNNIQKDVLEYFLGSVQITIDESSSPLSPGYCDGAEDSNVFGGQAEWLGGTNQPPTVTALEPSRESPQASGTAIVWTATAFDPEMDTLFYRFQVVEGFRSSLYYSAPAELKIGSDWSTSNVWTWYSSRYDQGLYNVYVFVRDGKHESSSNYDSSKCYPGFELIPIEEAAPVVEVVEEEAAPVVGVVDVSTYSERLGGVLLDPRNLGYVSYNKQIDG